MPVQIHHVPLRDASVPLTRTLLSASEGVRSKVCNIDDSASAAQWLQFLQVVDDSSMSSRGVSVDSKHLKKVLASGEASPLPTPLGSRKVKYTDSRKLEAEIEACLHDYTVAKAERLAAAPEVDEEGFVTVKNGFKPDEAVKSNGKEDDKLREKQQVRCQWRLLCL